MTDSMPIVHPFFDPETGTYSYVVADPASAAAAVVDPVLNYDARACAIGTRSARELLQFVAGRGLRVDWILETHAHADHLSAAAWLKQQWDGRPVVGIGRDIVEVQRTFKPLLGLGDEFEPDGQHFDRLFGEGDRFQVGAVSVDVVSTPGHTPDSVTYLAGDAAFIGDTMFMPDNGTARCDFPGGSAETLWNSIQRLLALSDATRLFVCHDYPPAGRDASCLTTPLVQRTANTHVGAGRPRDEFLALRRARDAQLAAPALLWPALQVNIRGGNLPAADANGRRHLRIPLGTEDLG